MQVELVGGAVVTKTNIGFSDLEAAGSWSTWVSNEQSNFWDLLAVLKCTKSFHHSLKGKVLQIISDNIITIACLNKLSTPSQLLSSLTKTTFAEAQDLSLKSKPDEKLVGSTRVLIFCRTCSALMNGTFTPDCS